MEGEENFPVVAPGENPVTHLASPSPASSNGVSSSNDDFFQLWKTRKPFVIGPPDDPYLLRWYVIPRNTKFNIYVHKFCRSDDDRALHDHPWWWLSLILSGGYWEHRAGKFIRWRSPGMVAISSPKTAHRVELDSGYCVDPEGRADVFNSCEKPAWTLFITGPKLRNWGFHCPKGWVPWEKFTAGKNGAEVGAGCGEFA